MDFFGILFDMKNGKKVPYSKTYFDTMFAESLTGVTTLTGTLPLTFTTSETELRSWTLHGAHVRNTWRYIRYSFPTDIKTGAAGAADTWTIYGNAEGVGERTKNLIDINGYDATFYRVQWYEENGQLKALGTYNDSSAHTQPRFYTELSAGTYTLSGSPDYEQTGIALQIGTCTDAQGTNYTSLGYDRGSGFTFTLQTDSWVSVRVYTAASLYQQTVDVTMPLMLRPADTLPEFIPYGYCVPLIISQTGQTTKNYEIFVGSSPLGAGQTVSDTQTIELFEGEQIIDIPLTNQPRLSIQVFSYYGIAYNSNSGYVVRLEVTHNGSTIPVNVPVPTSMDEGDTVSDVIPIPTEIGENTISLNWDEYPPTTMTIKFKE